MKNFFFDKISMITLLGAFFVSQPAFADAAKKKVAIKQCQITGIDLDKNDIRAELEQCFNATQKYEVVVRLNLKTLLEEQRYSGKNAETPVSADLFVTCRITKTGDGYIHFRISMFDINGIEKNAAPPLSVKYNKDTYSMDMRRVIAKSVELLTLSTREIFVYAIEEFANGNGIRASEVFNHVANKMPEEAEVSHRETSDEITEKKDPGEWFRMGWEAHEKGDKEKASKYFFECKNTLHINSFHDLEGGKQPDYPIPLKKWKIDFINLKFQPIKPGAASTYPISYDFWISTREISIRDYKIFLDACTTQEDRSTHAYINFQEGPLNKKLIIREGFTDNMPMTYVSWNGANAFAEWLTREERNKGNIPAEYSYRLPTDKEWCYIASHSSIKPDSTIQQYVVCGRDQETPEVCCSLKADNEIYDLFGNVAEWCLDEALDEEEEEEPSYGKIVRGGSFRSDYDEVMKYRVGKEPDSYFPTVGFRLVLGPDPK